MQRGTSRSAVKLSGALRQRQTMAESILWSKLRDRRLEGYKFRRQHAIGQYIVDFYCDEAKLAIELDGDIHTLYGKQEHDRLRDNALAAQGINTVRFTNSDVFHHIDSILQTIEVLLRPSPEPKGE